MTEKKGSKLNINWYPGHMEKARRDMQNAVKQVDLVIEIRDARIPDASRNPMLDTMISGKPRFIVLAKSDLADPDVTAAWIRHLEKDEQKAAAFDLVHDAGAAKKIIAGAMELTAAKREKMIAKGIRPRPVRAMACGIPNVGKSTLINRVTRKKSAKTEDRPGVTRNLTWIHASDTLDILDTPGVLWPKINDENTGICLAALGSINKDILNTEEIACRTIDILNRYYPGLLCELFALEIEDEPERMLGAMAASRHFFRTGSEPDISRMADVFLHELRRAKYGRLSLERPE